MNRSQQPCKSAELVAALCHELLLVAILEEELAADEAARTPYWSPCLSSVVAHRIAARALRGEIARLESGARDWSMASRRRTRDCEASLPAFRGQALTLAAPSRSSSRLPAHQAHQLREAS